MWKVKQFALHTMRTMCDEQLPTITATFPTIKLNCIKHLPLNFNRPTFSFSPRIPVARALMCNVHCTMENAIQFDVWPTLYLHSVHCSKSFYQSLILYAENIHRFIKISLLKHSDIVGGILCIQLHSSDVHSCSLSIFSACCSWWIHIFKWHFLPTKFPLIFFFHPHSAIGKRSSFGLRSNFVCCGLWLAKVFNKIGKFQCRTKCFTAKPTKSKIKYSRIDFHLPESGSIFVYIFQASFRHSICAGLRLNSNFIIVHFS